MKTSIWKNINIYRCSLLLLSIIYIATCLKILIARINAKAAKLQQRLEPMRKSSF